MRPPDAKTFMDMLKNSRMVKERVMYDLKWAGEEMQTYSNRVDMFAQGKTAKAEVMLPAMAKTMMRLLDMQTRMAILMLVYVCGDNFTSDAAGMAMKLGADPREALSEMLRKKVGR